MKQKLTPVRSTLVKLAVALALVGFAKADLRAQYATAPATATYVPDTVLTPRDGLTVRRHLRAQVLGSPLPPAETTPTARLANPDAAPPPVHRALFCRFDDDLDRKRIPLRMRLGDLETVNRKEGKPGW